MKTIYLLDLNAMLCVRPRPIWNKRDGIAFDKEDYLQWLVDLLKTEFVILFTVRSDYYQEQTLKNIQEKTGWQPQESVFRWFKELGGKQADQVKNKMLQEYVFPKYQGKVNFFALESNTRTHKMYKKHNIPWAKVYPNTNWDKLPTPQEHSF